MKEVTGEKKYGSSMVAPRHAHSHDPEGERGLRHLASMASVRRALVGSLTSEFGQDVHGKSQMPVPVGGQCAKEGAGAVRAPFAQWRHCYYGNPKHAYSAYSVTSEASSPGM